MDIAKRINEGKQTDTLVHLLIPPPEFAESALVPLTEPYLRSSFYFFYTGSKLL